MQEICKLRLSVYQSVRLPFPKKTCRALHVSYCPPPYNNHGHHSISSQSQRYSLWSNRRWAVNGSPLIIVLLLYVYQIHSIKLPLAPFAVFALLSLYLYLARKPVTAIGQKTYPGSATAAASHVYLLTGTAIPIRHIQCGQTDSGTIGLPKAQPPPERSQRRRRDIYLQTTNCPRWWRSRRGCCMRRKRRGGSTGQ